jgi:hypothetical protein
MPATVQAADVIYWSVRWKLKNVGLDLSMAGNGAGTVGAFLGSTIHGPLRPHCRYDEFLPPGVRVERLLAMLNNILNVFTQTLKEDSGRCDEDETEKVIHGLQDDFEGQDGQS